LSVATYCPLLLRPPAPLRVCARFVPTIPIAGVLTHVVFRLDRPEWGTRGKARGGMMMTAAAMPDMIA
jgi:hypothetical protein